MILKESILMTRKISDSDAFFEGMLSVYDLSGSFRLFDEELPVIKFENKTENQSIEDDFNIITRDYDRVYIEIEGNLIEQK